MSKTENDFEDSLEYWRDLAKMLREELKKEQASRELKLPSEYENSEAAKRFCQTKEAKSGFLYGIQWLKKQIKALNECEGEK